MIDINELRRLAQAANEHSDDRAEILAEFYAATQSDTIIELLDRIEAAEKERDALLARIEAMEKQEPVAWRTYDGEGGYDYRGYADNENYQLGWNARNPNHAGWVEPLYLAPGAQPASIIPEGWKLAPIEPTQEMSEAGVFAGGVYYDVVEAAYEAMLAAAPEAKPCP